MRADLSHIEGFRFSLGPWKSKAGDRFGLFEIPLESYRFRVMLAPDSNKFGKSVLWEHVSVSLKSRCPNWKEMCFIKDLFWNDEDVVVQFHPKKSEYVNLHKYCLHLFKFNGEMPTPPSILVGPKEEQKSEND